MKLLSKYIFLLTIIISFISCGKNTQKSVTSTEPELFTTAIDTNWTQKIIKTDEEWKKILTPEQYNITREQGTETPFTHEFTDIKESGIFVCVSCNNPLFSKDAKFDSGTGWPSFFKPYSKKSVIKNTDDSIGMSRDEIKCARCNAHLGHVFNDGPAPTGLRYCMDGIALKFVPSLKFEKVVFAQGCFWCTEHIFESVKGVKDVISGYAGGEEINPTYSEVGDGSTGHAESIEVIYDPTKITYEQLLKVYFNSGDITQENGQGNDVGTQYRSIIFYNNNLQKKAAEDYIKTLNQSGKYNSKIAVEVVAFKKFYPAENYHQNYANLHPDENYVKLVSMPRYEKAIKNFPELLK